MDVLRDQFLASAAFAEQQHAGFSGRDARNVLAQRLHRGRVADEEKVDTCLVKNTSGQHVVAGKSDDFYSVGLGLGEMSSANRVRGQATSQTPMPVNSRSRRISEV
mgnify:CR=1 FL=1